MCPPRPLTADAPPPEAAAPPGPLEAAAPPLPPLDAAAPRGPLLAVAPALSPPRSLVLRSEFRAGAPSLARPLLRSLSEATAATGVTGTCVSTGAQTVLTEVGTLSTTPPDLGKVCSSQHTIVDATSG
ncbi:hypothetical protein [Histidinibacterium lentulum]|uniref:hypothetical protein n=1 Tax=Histidinibacterium lentulum TaxID=2480588 RepID=UPI00162069B5|nr:hypothetical protein [Histidinibacterium lentulum]